MTTKAERKAAAKAKADAAAKLVAEAEAKAKADAAVATETIVPAEVGKVEEVVTQLAPGEGMKEADAAASPARKVELKYACDCCKREFISHRARQGEKLCADCIGLRRALKSFTKHGLTDVAVIERSKTLLNVK